MTEEAQNVTQTASDILDKHTVISGIIKPSQNINYKENSDSSFPVAAEKTLKSILAVFL